MQFHSVGDIDGYVNNPSEMETICFKFQLTISDPTIEESEKIKQIKNIYKYICENQGESDVVNRRFGDLYLLLGSATTGKHSETCTRKAHKLFNRIKDRDENEVSSAQIRLRRIKLSGSDSDRAEKKQAPPRKKTVPKIELNDLRKRVETDSYKNERPFANSEFEKHLDVLTAKIAEFEGSNKKINFQDRNCEESIFINDFIRFITKLNLCIGSTIEKINAHQINGSIVSRAVNISKNAILKIKEIEAKVEMIDISQDRMDFSLKIDKILDSLGRLIRVGEQKKEQLPEAGFECNEIIGLLNDVETMFSLFMKLIQEKSSRKYYSNISLSLAINAWSNFFKFTEENYFLIRDHNKPLFFQTLVEAEKIFEQFIEFPSISQSAFMTYISILAQKQAFLKIPIEQQKNLRKIQIYCHNYIEKMGKVIENAKTLHKILKSGTETKIERNLLSPKKSPINSTKRKVEKKITKIIEKHVKENLEIGSMLEEKKSSSKRSEVCQLMQNIRKTFIEIKKLDIRNHNLTDLDILKISYTVEKNFFFNSFEGCKGRDQTIKDQNLVFISKNELLSRPLLLSINEKFFVIMSKLHGDLKERKLTTEGEVFTYVQGGVKKISASVLVFPKENGLGCKEMILAVPKKGQVIDKKSIDYLFKFQNKRGLIGCHSYLECYKSTAENQLKFKQLLVQERAHGDLLAFLEAHPLIDITSWKDFFSILEDIIWGLDYMHSSGDVHWDLKIQNILVLKEEQKYVGVLNDFDTTFNAHAGEQPPWLFPLYGTANYRAPEIDHKNILYQELTEEQAKRRDMFAVGCLFLDIFNFSNSIETKSPLYEEIAAKRVEEEKIDEYIGVIEKSFSGSYKEFLEVMAYHLIHPNPSKRWTVRELKEKMTAFQMQSLVQEQQILCSLQTK